MSNNHHDPTQQERYLLGLLELLRDKTIRDEQFLELQHLVINDPVARCTYVNAITMQSNLEWTQNIIDSTESVPEEFQEESTVNLGCDADELPSKASFLPSPTGQLLDGLVEDWYQAPTSTMDSSNGSEENLWGSIGKFFGKTIGSSIGFTLGVSIVVILPVFLLFIVMMSKMTTAELPVVATIVRQTEGSKWSSSTTSLAGLNVLLGQRFRLQSGTAEIQMVSGVRVLLEEDTSIFFAGPNTLYLERGALVAQVMPEAIGFTVRTPSADFVDLGTEFGVRVKPGEACRAKVFKGIVNVQIESEGGKKKEKLLHVNEAANITLDGKIEPFDPNSIAFTTVYPDDRICLFNLICHTNAYYPEGLWINPVDGELRMPNAADLLLSTEERKLAALAGYSTIPSIPVLDGIFVPVPDTQTQVNSKGGYFGDVRNQSESNFLHSCLIIGKLHEIENWKISDYYRSLLAEATKTKSHLLSKERAFMDIHANLGVTFDLEAVHRQTGRKVVHFSTMAIKIEDTHHPKVEEPTVLDIIILADEKPIYEKRGVTLQEGAFPIRVDIPTDTQFLTIISADGADGNAYNIPIECDHLILDSPAFVLENKFTKKDTRN